MMRRAFLITSCLILSACGGDPVSDSASEPDAASEMTSSSDSLASDAEGPEPEASGSSEAPTDTDAESPLLVGTLLDVQQGDRACYLTLADDTGVETVVLASFDLCGPPDLTGQRVQLITEPAEVMAMSCEGDPSCPDTETVELATAMEPAE